MAVETEGNACAVRCICVNPGFEARGVANQLLDWVEGLAIDRRLSRLVALVPESDAPSLRLYRGHGFSGHASDAEMLSLEKPLPGIAARAPMRVTLIAVPYDLGRADVGSGRGPTATSRPGPRRRCAPAATRSRSSPCGEKESFGGELQAVLAVDEAVAVAVDEALFGDSFPLVVAGDCNVTLGVRAGLQRGGDGEAALVWLDAHGDFNTPATTKTGYLDGMPLAMLCGRAYAEAVERGLESEPLEEEVIIHAGGQSSTAGSTTGLLSCGILLVDGGGSATGDRPRRSLPALDALAATCRDAAGLERDDAPPAHLHVDLDVLEPEAAPGVAFAAARPLGRPAPGGDRPRARALHARRGHRHLLHARPGRSREQAGCRPRRAPARHQGAGPAAMTGRQAGPGSVGRSGRDGRAALRR